MPEQVIMDLLLPFEKIVRFSGQQVYWFLLVPQQVKDVG
jgi:hypothetical protein